MVLLSRSSMGWHHTTRVSCQGGKVWWRASSSKVGCSWPATASALDHQEREHAILGQHASVRLKCTNCHFRHLTTSFWQYKAERSRIKAVRQGMGTAKRC